MYINVYMIPLILVYKLLNFQCINLGFSMIDWLRKHNLPSLSSLPEYGQLEILTDLGLANYMKITQCTDLDDIYRYQSYGWTKGQYITHSYQLYNTPLFACNVCQSVEKDRQIDWIVFYAASAIFQPYNGGERQKEKKKMQNLKCFICI